MRCIRVSKFGGPEVMELSNTEPTPKPSGKKVLINVKAVGINPLDVYIRAGILFSPSLPFVPGCDGAGVVTEFGDEVTKFKKGDRVWFSTVELGSYSEYCLVSEENIGTLPESSTFEDGSMLGIPYLTAFRALFQKGKLQKEDTVFIHGASGGVGTAAVQMAKAFGARVIGTAGSSDGIALLDKLGIDVAYNHKKEGYLDDVKKNEDKIDLILEMLGNVNLINDLNIISVPNRRIVIIGSRGTIAIDPIQIAVAECIVTGVLIFKSTPEEKAEQYSHISEGLKKGWIKPVLWRAMGLERAEEAHRFMENNTGAQGQIVLKL